MCVVVHATIPRESPAPIRAGDLGQYLGLIEPALKSGHHILSFLTVEVGGWMVGGTNATAGRSCGLCPSFALQFALALSFRSCSCNRLAAHSSVSMPTAFPTWTLDYVQRRVALRILPAGVHVAYRTPYTCIHVHACFPVRGGAWPRAPPRA